MCEAVVPTPKLHKKNQEHFNARHEASSEKVFKEHWLRRYKHSYPGKLGCKDDNVDLLSVSQMEPPSFIAGDLPLLPEKSKVDKVKVPPVEKVQQWLEKNEDEFDKDQTQSFESNNVEVTADVHRGMEDETDLMSVSQQQFYIAPRKGNMAALQDPLHSLCDNVKQASSEKRIFTSRNDNENNTKPGERVRQGQSTEGDPFEFISSQKIRTLPKKKLKGKSTVEKRENKDFKTYGLSLRKGNNECSGEKGKIVSNSPPTADITFICPVDINDTFDKLVANTRKFEPAKSVKPVPEKEVTADENSDDDMCLFRTPLDVSLIYQKNDDSTTESMSDIDFSSDSGEEWGVTNQANRRKTRLHSCDDLPKVRDTTSNCEQKTRSKSSGSCNRTNTKLETFGFGCKRATKRNLRNEDTLKKTPLSPTKKLNLTTDVGGSGISNVNERPSVCKVTDDRTKEEPVTCLSTDKAPTGKENVICPVANDFVDEKINLDHSAVNTSVISRSPGWSRISQSKKDFERFKKPSLKALNVSGGEVCIPKRHSTSISEMPQKPDVTKEVMSPVPTIDDSDSGVGIPLVAFSSPEAMNKVKMMSEIVMNLESQIRCYSTENVAEVPLHSTTKDVTLKKFAGFGSDGFSEPVGTRGSPNSCQRMKLQVTVVPSLDDNDPLDRQCNGGNDWPKSGITDPDGDVEDAQDGHGKDNDNTKNTAVYSNENVLVVQESNSTMGYEEDEHNQDSHSKDNYNTMKNLAVDMSEECTSVVRDHNSIMACEETCKSVENNQDSNMGDDYNMKNPVTDIGTGNIPMVQAPETSAVDEEAIENTEETCVMDQCLTATREDCTGISRSAGHLTEPTAMSSKNLNTQTEISAETPVGPSLTASGQHPQDFVLSKICDEGEVPLMSSEVPENRPFRTCSTEGMFAGVQPQVMSAVHMEVKATNSHQTEIQSSHNSSGNSGNNCLDKIHIPFIKYGRLKSLRNFTKFMLLGSLAPRKRNMISETHDACSSVEIVGGQFGMTATTSSGMCHETGTQTSPRLLKPRHTSDIINAKIHVTPRVNANLVQFITPTSTQGDYDSFVPDSCDSTYSFPCAIPLCRHSAMQRTPVHLSKDTKTEHCLKTSALSDPIDVEKALVVSDMKDDVAEDDAGINADAVLRNHCGHKEPASKADFEISSSQLRTATTVKIQHVGTSGNENHVLEKSPELSSNLTECSSLGISVIQGSSNGSIVSNIQDPCYPKTGQEAQDSNPCNEGVDAESCQQIEVTGFKRESSTEELPENFSLKSMRYRRNGCRNTSEEISSRRSSRASRQLTFSPNVIPMLSDPCLDVNIEDKEKDVEKLHKTSYKRIREVAASSDYVSDSRELSDVVDVEQKEIKKPCYTSLRKASGEGKDNELHPDDERAETSTEVIDLLTPPEEANVSLASHTDDKWLGEDVPNSEELMARLMANIEADLKETRTHKMKGCSDSDKERGKESPTLFTPPPARAPVPVPLVAESEELGSRMTCELVAKEVEAEPRERPVKDSLYSNMTVGADIERLYTQERDTVQVGTATILK
jgi:hypothetical protein